MTRRPRAAGGTQARSGSAECSSPKRRPTSWSGASGSSGTCRRPSASTWPASSVSRPRRSRSGSKTIATR
ncbi:rCG27595, isoform CRA_b [Rattus norvegicus]|uniref:RCG27595, isoform CRA_b n=1 Tax=Rattus norvegicus TaxID=10116 RepID=A6K7A4_RAT|nr:rCG27595, isoform CRA_b [Rattus norvegicus]